MTKEEFEKVFAETAEKSGVAGMARDYQFAENLEAMMCELRDKLNSLPSEQLSEDLEKASYHVAMKLMNNPNFTPKTILGQFISMLQGLFKDGAQWQKEQITKLLKTIYSDCDNLKNDLDRVTTGNLPHRIGNIKFSITGIQVIIKQAMEDEQ